ncbi:NAD-dependent epimerase/dehydratase family protein [Virgisporangium aurantiacum]|uniref:SnoG protein n=1 Tax=Virgisporangium aurantiacum TaxID=175570 RepID=A0A8J3ZEX2_9ACTN|nr:NAD(P)-dependent oxidoreductase [Virgisporangium aurantiacum]GIJ60380.1 snoG protein [Virgisporangium aurantiacum]
MTARAVVLGGTGFVGRHVCDALARAGYRVTVVGRGRAPALDLSTASTAQLHAALAAVRPALVVNAAGAVWRPDPGEVEPVNTGLVARLVDAVERLPGRTRLVQLGTVHEVGPVPPGTPIRESTPPHPVSPYGRTKLAATRLVLAAAAAGRVDAVVLRTVNAIGAGMPAASLFGGVAAELAQAARAGATAVLRTGRLAAECDFVDVRDVAAAVCAAATRAPAGGALVNIGRGEAVPVDRLVRDLVAISGVPTELSDRDGPGAANATGVRWQAVDVTVARRLLGWRPRRPLLDSLHTLWAAASPVPAAPASRREPA